jgi:hypothetical protein
MKIVIDIPNRLIKKVKDHYENPYEVDEICKAILDGTPLPEHHGRLIDGDMVLDDIVKKNPEWVSETGKRKRYARLVYYWAVKNAPTIVEGSGSK